MILANGFPKSGTHALMKAMALLGCVVQHSHWSYGTDVSEYGKHIYIKRDPRNVLLSKVRSLGLPVTQGTVIQRMRLFDKLPFAEELRPFLPWLTNAPLVVSYEELISTDSTVRRIADYLEVPYLSDAFDALPGHTRSWMPDHSDYRTVWTPEVEDAWSEIGGPSILKDWGYG